MVKKFISFWHSVRFHTTFRLHQKATSLKWYKRWHEFRFHPHFHYAFLFSFLLSLTIAFTGFFVSPNSTFAAGTNWIKTTFNGSTDGTYTNTTPANGGADVALNPILSNAGGSGWQYKRPITVTNGSGGALVDQLVQVQPFTDSTFINNTGLVGSWHLNGGTSGAIANAATTGFEDLSGSNNNGTASNVNGTGMSWSSGKFAGATTLDGVDDYVNVANSSSLTMSTTVSVEAWVKTTALSGAIVGKLNSTTPWAGYALEVQGGKLAFWYGNNASWAYSTASVNDGNWHHVVATFDSSNTRFYIDGSLDSTVAKAGTAQLSSTANLYIGVETNGGFIRYFNGQIDEVKVYNRVITGPASTCAVSSANETCQHAGTMGVPKIRGDYADLRFTNAVTGVEYPFYQETDGKYWIKISETLPTGTNTNFLNMYYGNPSATYSRDSAEVSTFKQPNTLANLKAWYKPSALDSADGTAVSDLTDYSGNSKTASQATSTYQPIVKRGVLNGKPVVRFDGSDDWLSATSIGAGYTPEVYVVGKILTYNSSGIMYSEPANGYTSGTYSAGSGNVGTINTAGTLKTSRPLALGASAVIRNYFARNLGTNASQFAVNGNIANYTLLSNDYSATNLTNLDIGRFPAPSHYQNIDLGEMLVFSSPLSVADRQALEIYMGAKYGFSVTPATTQPTASVSASEALAYNTSGSYTSSAQAPVGVYNWGTLTYTKTTPGTSTATVDVLNGATNAVISSNVVSGTNLNLLGLTYPSVKIKVNYTTSNIGEIPTFSDWNLAYSYDMTAPTVPTGFVIGAITSNSVALNWTASTDADPGIAGYEVQRAPDSVGLPGTWAGIASGQCSGTVATNACVDDDTALLSNTKYYYRIRAKDGGGNYSGYSGEMSADTNVVGLWHLDEGAGTTITDASGNGFSGALNNAGAWNSNGKIGSSFLGSGTSYYASIPNNAVLSPSTITVEAWVNPTSLPVPSDAAAIVDKRDTLGQTAGYLAELYNNAGTQTIAWITTNAGLVVNYTLPVGVWTHLAFVQTGTTATIYANGVQIGTGAAPAIANYATPLLIGKRSDGYYFKGKIDEVRISNVARSASSILAYLAESNSQPVSATTLTGTPTDITASPSSSSQITLGWAAPVGGASRYHVKYSADGYASNIYDDTATAFASTSLSPNTGYTYRVYSVNGVGQESTTYAEITKYTLAATPSATADIVTSDWKNTSNVTFTSNIAFGAGGTTKYKYAWDANATHTWTGSETDEWTAGTLTRSMSYGSNYLHLQSYNGDSIASGSLDMGPYYFDNQAPTGSVTITSGAYVSQNPTAIVVEVIDPVGGSGSEKAWLSNDGVTYCEVPEGSVLWDFTGLLTGANIYGVNCGLGYTGDGAMTIYSKYSDLAGNVSSVEQSQTTLDETNPTNPSATVSAEPVAGYSGWYKSLIPTFTISGATDATSGVAGYYVYFGTNDAAEPLSDGLLQTGATYTPTISVNDSGRTFYFRVRAVDNAGNVYFSGSSADYTVFTYRLDATPPAAINYITPSPAGWSATNNFDFSWPKVADIDTNGASSGIAGYLYRSKTAADEDVYEAWDNTNRYISQPVGATVQLSDIVAGFTGVNVLQVKAVDNVGNESAVIPVNYYYSGDIPAPGALSVDLSQSAGQTVNRFSFTWSKPAGIDVQGYYYSVNATPSTQNTTYIPSTEATVSTGFASFASQKGLNHFYVVTKANDTVGWTNYATVDFSCDTVAPGIPTGLMITDSSARDTERWQLTINWDQPAQTTSDFNGYSVERSTDGTNFTEVATTSASTTGYLDTNLLNVTTYYYRVKAKDNIGNKSASSSIVSRQPTGRYTEPPEMIGDPIIDVQATKATVRFTTARNADSFVQIGTSTSYGMTQGQLDSTSTHVVELSGLTPGVFYHYRTMWRDIDGNIGYSNDFTFRTQDAPGISEVSISSIGLTSALVSWKTNTVSSSVVKFGKTNAYGSQVEDRSGSGVTVHLVKLDGLTDSTTYHFKITGTDTDGNGLNSDDYSFETLTFPRVSDVKIVQKTDEATSTVVVTWNTNVPTDSVVSYSGGGINKESSKALLEQKHSITITNLRDNTAYQISVGGRDAYGNQAESSSASYKTAFDTRPPQASAITTETSIMGYGVDAKGQVIVSWETDEPSTSQVRYGVGVSGADYSQMTQEDTGLTTTHVVVISGLRPSTAYHFQVVSRDSSGNQMASEDGSFLTDQASSSVLDIIINSLQSTIGWIFGSFTRG